MDDRLHLDLETYSECDLKAAGVYVYAEHPSTEVLCMCYAFNDEPVQLWRPGMDLDRRVVEHIGKGLEIRAHNAQFERTVLNGVAGAKIGFPKISIQQTVCTAAKVAAHSLPRSLGEAAAALGTAPKSEGGRVTMLQLSKPRRGKDPRYTRENAPEKFAILEAYCADDVTAERAIDHAVPDLPASELAVYHLDQEINDRGWKVDLDAIADAQFVVDQYKQELALECERLTRPAPTEKDPFPLGLSPTQRDKIAEWVRAHGCPKLKDMTADTVNRIIERGGLPPQTERVLRIYSTYGNKAVSKLESMRQAVSSDGRLRGMFLYHGAGTGRWSSLRVQFQNIFRGVISDPDTAIEALRTRDLNWIRFLYPGIDPMKVIASCIRGMLVAA